MGEVIKALRLVITGDSKGAKAAIADLVKGTKEAEATQSGLMKAMKVGAVAAAAGVAGLILEFKKADDTYMAWGKGIKEVQRLMGGTVEQASTLIGTMKLIGGEDVNPAAALAIFSKNLGKAQQEGGPAADILHKLGVELKNKDGEARPAIDVFNEMRSAVSKLSDAQERNYDLSVLMGRGYRQVLPLFTKSDAEVAKLNKTVKDMGLVWGDKQLTTWQELAMKQKEMTMLWTAFQVKVAQSVLPVLSLLEGTFRKVLWAIQPFAPVLKYVAVLLGLYLAAVLPIIAAHKLHAMGTRAVATAKTILAMVTRTLTNATRAETLTTKEGAVFMIRQSGAVRALAAAKALLKTVTGGLNTVLASTAGKLGLVSAALAFTITAIMGAVAAWRSYEEAAKQADAAYSGAQGTASKDADYIKQKYGEGSSQYKSWMAKTAGARAGIEKDKFDRPDWYNPISWFGKGGSFDVSKPTVIGVGDTAEHVEITPAGKSSSAGRQIVLRLDFSGANFYGSPKGAMLEEWADALMGPLGKRLQDALGGAVS